MTSVFFDTWAWLALMDRHDSGHAAAAEADAWIEANHQLLVTSDYVLDEAITGLHMKGLAVTFIDLIEHEVATEDLMVLTVDGRVRGSALGWFRRLAPDTPRLSLTDCTSFALLDELKITSVFTADRHFAKAGPKVHRLIAEDRGRLVFRPPLR